MTNKAINNKTFCYITTDKSITYELIFTQGYPLKYTHLGKTWAKRTECVLKINGFIKKVEFITKHEKDKDDLLYAYMNVYNKLKMLIHKEARIYLTNQILEYIKINQK